MEPETFAPTRIIRPSSLNHLEHLLRRVQPQPRRSIVPLQSRHPATRSVFTRQIERLERPFIRILLRRGFFIREPRRFDRDDVVSHASSLFLRPRRVHPSYDETENKNNVSRVVLIVVVVLFVVGRNQ